MRQPPFPRDEFLRPPRLENLPFPTAGGTVINREEYARAP